MGLPDRVKKSRITIIDRDGIPETVDDRFPVAVVLDNIRSAYNVGSMLRTAECARISKIYLCGISASPPNRKLSKTALHASQHVPWVYTEDSVEAVLQLKREGYRIISFETTDKSGDLWKVHLKTPVALVFGHEVTGVSMEILEISDDIVQIPMFGYKNSLNVSTAMGIALFETIRKVRSGVT